MAEYRNVHVSFWTDPDMEELSPEGRYFYLTLMTNPKTNQAGIYEITLKQLVIYTGYNRETVMNLLDRFEKMGKIRYSMETRELAMKKWPKWNMSRSPKVIKHVLKNLANVKDRGLIRWVYGGQDKWTEISLLKWYEDGMDTVSIEYLQKEEEQEKEQEEEKEKGPRFTPADHRLALRLLDQVRDKRTKAQLDKIRIEKWAETFRLMRERDGFSVEDLDRVLDYLKTAPRKGDFCWSDVILSADNMRKHLQGHLYTAVFYDRPRQVEPSKPGHNPFDSEQDLEQSAAYRAALNQGAGNV